MKKINKLSAAMAVALSIGVAPCANAVIELKHNGRGDALLFPFYNGNAGFENYFAITNDASVWIQGHLRFRGAAWTGELRDFDVILSPGDVFVFRIADIDGDGQWEVDESLDIKNFQYTGLAEVPDQGDLNLSTSTCRSEMDGSTMKQCMDPSFDLIPSTADGIIRDDLIEQQKHVGYVEFIGEAVLDDMNHDIMAILLSGVPGDWEPYQTDVFSRRGTSAWKWGNAANQFARYVPARNNGVWSGDRGLSDVPNVLAGVGFVSMVGMGSGLAYNAETFVNFRTGMYDHRVDNYRIAKDGFNLDVIRDADGDVVPGNDVLFGGSTAGTFTHTEASEQNRAVIVHDENGAGAGVGISPYGDYVYRFQEETNALGSGYEGRISFDNTWGPTLADGDDYNMTRFAGPLGNVYGVKALDSSDGRVKDVNLRWTAGTGFDKFGSNQSSDPTANERDDFDIQLQEVGNFRAINSIAEVEEAIRVGGQFFTGFYFDGAAPGANHQGGTSLRTWFLAWYPTKFFYGERPDYYSQTTLDDYIVEAVRHLLMMGKIYSPQVWDINENTGGGTTTTTTIGQCVSPAVGPECITQTITVGGIGELIVSEELSVFDIKYIKDAFAPQVANFINGRIGLYPLDNDPVSDAWREARYRYSWPGLLYSFEWGDDGSLAHWRALHR